MSKFELKCAFLVKVILIDFQLEKYMQCKEKDVYNFCLQYKRHSDVTKWGTVFSLAPKSLYVVGLFTHLNNLIFMFAALKWLKTSIETLK